MQVVIIGAGIGGLALALALHKAGIRARLVEAVPEFKPLGVGLNLLPHAVRDLAALGVGDRLAGKGIATRELCFYTHHGQLVDREPRGRVAGYEWPQISIHRADLHAVLLDAVIERLGRGAVTLDRRCVAVEQDAGGVTLHCMDHTGAAQPPLRGDVAIGCDGIHSAVRKQLHPAEPPLVDHETTSYRGVTRWTPFLTGASMVYAGTFETGKLIIYPMRDNIDAQGRQLLNWVIELKKQTDRVRDWNRQVDIEECIAPFTGWHFDWLDVPAVLRAADTVLQYPMIDQEPLPLWGRGRVTLLGDAAHAMLPRGSNGAAQAIIDASVLANLLSKGGDPADALQSYEAARRPATTEIVRTNRHHYPDAILRVVQERTGGKPFGRIEDVISREEIDRYQDHYKQVAGFQRDQVKASPR